MTVTSVFSKELLVIATGVLVVHALHLFGRAALQLEDLSMIERNDSFIRPVPGESGSDADDCASLPLMPRKRHHHGTTLVEMRVPYLSCGSVRETVTTVQPTYG
jgi:hypothetical protein